LTDYSFMTALMSSGEKQSLHPRSADVLRRCELTFQILNE
jgi:hypothetical protein